MKKLLAAFLCILLLSSCSALAQDTAYFPEFEAPLLSSDSALTHEIFAQADFTLVKFWATWCSACRMEMAEYPALLEDQEYSIQILGVVMDDLDVPDSVYEAILKTVKKITSAASLDAFENYFCVLPDDSIFSLAAENVQYLPTTYIVDSQGRVLDIQVGALSFDEWKERLSSLTETMELSLLEKEN